MKKLKSNKTKFPMNYFPNLSKLKLTCSLILVLMNLPFFTSAQEGEDELPESFYGQWVEDMAQCEVAAILSIGGSEEGLTVSTMEWHSREVQVKKNVDFYTLLIKGVSSEGDFETEINVKMGEEGTLIFFVPGLEETKLVKCNGDLEFVEVEEMVEMELEDAELEVVELDMSGTMDLEFIALDLPFDFYGYWVEDLAQCEVAPILSIVDSGDGLSVSSLDWSSKVVEVQNKGDFYALLIKGSSEEGDFETEINVKMGDEGNLIYFYPGLEETKLVKCDLGESVEFVEVEMEEMELVEAELEVEEFDVVDTVSLESINIELLQGKWQSLEDESSFLIFDGDRMQIYTEGMEEEMEDEAFMVSDTCMNESDGSNDLPQEENRYLSNPNLDMCWYIEVLDASNLSLIYLSRGNQLTYRRVE